MLRVTALLSSEYKQCLVTRYCTRSTYVFPSRADEFTERPQYPSCVPNAGTESPEEKARAELREKIKRQPTVEEKLFVVNVPRKWGWKCFMIHEGVVPFNNLTFAQHVTRTHVKKTDSLPGHYENRAEKCSHLTQQIKSDLVDSIEYQLGIRRDKIFKNLNAGQRSRETTKMIVCELNRIIMNSISNEMLHIRSVQTDLTPRIEASWQVHSLTETFVREEYKEGIPLHEIPEEYLERPSDKFLQYLGHPIAQLRHASPLKSVIPLEEANIFNYAVPVYEYDPHITLGYEMERRHVTNIPGFWPGDQRDFSFLSYHWLNHVKCRPSTYGIGDAEQAAFSQVIFASFGWLMALACYQGFSVYNDVTYPLVTQTVATDGREFVFAIYQLNTTETHYSNPYENPRCNVCWVTPAMPLYDEFSDGKIKGFNERTLQMLLQLYVNAPMTGSRENLKPYLGEKLRYIADHENEEKREWLEKHFKSFSTNKAPSRTDRMYEVYDWEKIFKIQYRMRPRDARKRPFELRQNPYHAKMSDEKGSYIPKAYRPDKHLPKWKQRKYARTFYPE